MLKFLSNSLDVSSVRAFLRFVPRIEVKKTIRFISLCVLFSSVLFVASAFAEEDTLFSSLTSTGAQIFTGMREIVYAVAGFGVVAVAIGGFFGNLNWKWLSAIIIGLVIIALTGGIITYMTGGGVTVSGITDTLK